MFYIQASSHLNRLPVVVLFVDVDPDNRVVKFRVGWLNKIVVCVFFVTHCIEAFKDELKKSVQILGTRARHEDVGVAEANGRRDSKTKCSWPCSCKEVESLRDGF